jgi:hypothetical protein
LQLTCIIENTLEEQQKNINISIARSLSIPAEVSASNSTYPSKEDKSVHDENVKFFRLMLPSKHTTCNAFDWINDRWLLAHLCPLCMGVACEDQSHVHIRCTTFGSKSE